jgi:archaellum component FlaF (FlaF/FlaG flagellin family)
MKKIMILLSAVLVLSACSDKKMVVMSKGPAEVNTDAKTIKAIDGSGHEEKEVTLGGGKVVFKLNTPAGEATVEILDNGLYVVNVKNDTIIGSYQKYSDPKLAPNMVTQEALKQQIDSLQLLSEGKNVSPANRNFYILPNHAVKISDNTKAMVVGPYHRIRSAEKVDGKDPEVYRFYSIKEIRENIAKMVALTVPEKK